MQLLLICLALFSCLDANADPIRKNDCEVGQFQCYHGECISASQKCDLKTDCADGSDESFEQCTPIPENAISQTPSNSKKNCTITTNSTTLRAKTIFNGMPLMSGRTVAHQTTIRLICQRDHDIRGDEFNTCEDGSWMLPFPICLKNCDKGIIGHDPKHTNVCFSKGKFINCETSPLVEGTMFGSVCAPGYKNKTSVTSAEKKCINGRWQNQGKRLQCIVDCGKTFNTVDGFPWVVSIYQRSFQFNYEYSCLGVIIDPSYVLTVRSCFSEETKPKDVIVVLGKHTVGFNTEEEHGFDYFRIKKPEVEELKPIAVLEMVNPFILSAKVRPICADRLTNTNSPTSVMNHTVYLGESHNLNFLSLGEPLTHFNSVKKRYSLTHIVDEKNVIRFNDSEEQVTRYIKDNYIKNKNTKIRERSHAD